MEQPQNKPIYSILETMGILPSFSKEHQQEHLKILQQLETKVYDWQVEDIDRDLIHGYYQVDGREVEQVLQTPFKNYCIAKIDNNYDLFHIGSCYRPLVVPFKEHPEVKQWFEQELGGSVLKN